MSQPQALGGLGAAGVVEAYRLMRDGALILIIATIFTAIGTMVVFFGSLPFMVHRPPLEAFAGLMVGAVIALVIGAAITLYGLWGKFIPGVEKLAAAKPGYETSKTLIRIGLFWGTLITMIGAILILVIVGIFIVIIGSILLIVGYVGLFLLALKLYEEEKNTLYLVAAILYILGIFVSLAGVVGWILLYVALGESIRRAQTPTPPTQPVPL
jgi:uncharacterized membrane protein